MSTQFDVMKIRDLAHLLHDTLSDARHISEETQHALTWLTDDILHTAQLRLDKLDAKEEARLAKRKTAARATLKPAPLQAA